MSDAEKKTKKSMKKPDHPPFKEMIVAALKALKDRTGSSRQAIDKYILANYNVKECGTHLKLALKRLVEKGTIINTKGKGASGSFKLNKEAKVEKKKPAKKPAAKKPAAKKPKSPAKKAAKKTAAKKPKSPGKKKADKPKKTKKPAAKPKPAKKPATKKPAKKAAKKPAKKAAKSPAKKK